MHRGVNGDDSGPALAQAFGRPFPTVGGSVVHDPENARGGTVGLLPHELINQTLERNDPGFALAAPMDLSPTHVPRRQISPGAHALVLVLHSHRCTGRWRHRRVDPMASLDTGFFIGGEHTVGGGQRLPFPNARVQIQHFACSFLEGGVARKYPCAVSPRSNRVLGEPPPDGGVTDRGDEASSKDFPPDLGDTEAGQREAQQVRKLASKRPNRDDDSGGKSGLAARVEVALRDSRSPLGRIACAIC